MYNHIKYIPSKIKREESEDLIIFNLINIKNGLNKIKSQICISTITIECTCVLI